jgi:GNAT superfamily N-acetyltransferase
VPDSDAVRSPSRDAQPGPQEVILRPARPSDVPAIAACVFEAYFHYIERMGRQPAPMLQDYAHVVRQSQVIVAVAEDVVVGIVVLIRTEEGYCLDNVAVLPSHQGRGVGRRLLQFAESEAVRQGYDSIYLYTNELMTEDRALYGKIGYVDREHRVVDGYTRVYLRKQLR